MTALEQAIKDSEEREKAATGLTWFEDSVKVILHKTTFTDNDAVFIANARTWEPRFREMVKLLLDWILLDSAHLLAVQTGAKLMKLFEELECIAKEGSCEPHKEESSGM